LSSASLTRVIVPHSGRTAFGHALRSLITDFRQARQIAWQFFLRDTRADFRQSLLGYGWLLVNPIANTVIWVFLNKQNVVSIDSGEAAYPLFVLSGTILWTAFTVSLTGILNLVGNARSVLGKVNFPHESLVYATVQRSILDSIVASIVLIPALIVFPANLSATSLLFPVALLVCILIGAVIGLALSPIGSLFSDISRGIHLILRFGFFLAPVIFPLPSSRVARTLMLMNPVSPILVSGRSWLLGSGETMPVAFSVLAISSIVLVGIGLLVFKVTLPYLIERLT
jgi:lipopolysaccharide transport system permease protein